MGSQQQVTNFKVKVKMIDPPNKIRPGMSSTVNIISETIKDTISIPIQSLTSRPENYIETGNAKKDSKKYRREKKGNKDDDKENNGFASKKNTIDVVFVLEEEFDGETASEGRKYALVRPVTVGISGENHYAVKSGVLENEMIVTGGYRILSKELNHGTLVSIKNDPKIDNGKSDQNRNRIENGFED
jgi:HlyD family secretion protein